LNTRILFKKSIASAGAPGYLRFKSILPVQGNDSRYSSAL
jgi:hypothetical protein